MKYIIMGAAKSGIAAARLAMTYIQQTNKDASVLLNEQGEEERFLDVSEELRSLGVKCVFGADTQTKEQAENCLAEGDLLIISPGVPHDAPFVKVAQERGVKVVSEMEFGFCLLRERFNNPIIAITGTNGKTTTTSLIEYLFNHSGKNAIAAGNIGLPLCDVANDLYNGKLSVDTFIVLEVSSYQLEFIDTFRPDLAFILNITPDHLKYHKTFENYIKAKFAIAKNQTESDYLVFNGDDEVLQANSNTYSIKSTILQFSLSNVKRGIYSQDGVLYSNINIGPDNIKEEVMLTNEIRIPGIHNQYNSMAAIIAGKIWEISNEDIRDSLMSFRGVEHRLEYVRTIDGVDYVNDSKATNVNATWYALQSYRHPLVWIAGGRGDNNDYSPLDALVKKNVRQIIAIGEEQDAIYERYKDMVGCYKADDLYEAVRLANNIATSGEIVLFTPACKSFDQFSSYEHRGKVFKQAVDMLAVNLN